MKLSFPRALLSVAFISALMFTFGFTMHKYRYFPYEQLRVLVSRELTRIRGDVNTTEILSHQYSYNVSRISAERDVSTALLPIKINGGRASDLYEFPKTGGAITTIGNLVIVLDRLGSLHVSSPTAELRRLEFPPLPNNLDAYLAAGYAIDTTRFRAYGIKYLDARNTLVVSHEAFDVDHQATRMAVSLLEIDRKTLRAIGTWRTIFMGDLESDGPNDASGGALASDGRDTIYLSIGVYNIKGTNIAQQADSKFGKIFEINLSTGKARMLSMGHRNPQGLTMTSAGELWSTEHGPAGGDELNLIEAGFNYGWPIVTLGTDYGTYDWSVSQPVGRHTGFQSPIFAWVPSIAVSRVIEVTNFNERWNGDLLVGSLKGLSLFRLRVDGKRVVYSEPIWIGQRIRDIAQLQNGTIALWTDDTQLLFISSDKARLSSNRRLSEALGETLLGQCMYCHHFGPTNPGDAAPSLSDLFQRRIGSDNFRYSAEFRSKEGAWTKEGLKEFLSNPGKFVNGTSMPTPKLATEDIKEIINILEDPKGYTEHARQSNH